MKSINVGVAVSNSNGEPDLLVFKIQCTNAQYEEGDHYDFAKEQAEAAGCDAHLAFDQHDPAWYFMDSTVLDQALKNQSVLSMSPTPRDEA